MKLFTNLPGNLRVLFAFLRFTFAVGGIFWLLLVTFEPWLQQHFDLEEKIMITGGEVYLPANALIGSLTVASAKPGSLAIEAPRGRLKIDLGSGDPATAAAARWSSFPGIILTSVFAWLLFSALRNVCANIERAELFSDRNRLLVRNIGFLLIGYGVVGLLVAFCSIYYMDGYLAQHVTVEGLPLGAAGRLHFEPAPGFISYPTSVIIGALVLLVGEAFRQGLNLKTESDLTV